MPEEEQIVAVTWKRQSADEMLVECGRALEAKGEIDSALDYYRSALLLKESSYAAWCLLQLALKSDLLDRVSPEAIALLQADKEHIPSQLLLSKYFIALGRYYEALAIGRLLQGKPGMENPAALAIGLSLCELEQWDDLRAYLQEEPSRDYYCVWRAILAYVEAPESSIWWEFYQQVKPRVISKLRAMNAPGVLISLKSTERSLTEGTNREKS